MRKHQAQQTKNHHTFGITATILAICRFFSEMMMMMMMMASGSVWMSVSVSVSVSVPVR